MNKARGIPVTVVHEVRDRCLCLAAQRSARKIARRFDQAFRGLGITNNQFSLMVALCADKPWRMGALAELLAMDRTTLTAALRTLERRALVRLTPDPEDQRARLISLTAAGKHLVSQAVTIWREEHARLDRELTPERAEKVRKSLGILQA